jgi:hypothetical protein
MTRVMAELRGMAGDHLAYWAVRLAVWALLVDPERVEVTIEVRR